MHISIQLRSNEDKNCFIWQNNYFIKWSILHLSMLHFQISSVYKTIMIEWRGLLVCMESNYEIIFSESWLYEEVLAYMGLRVIDFSAKVLSNCEITLIGSHLVFKYSKIRKKMFLWYYFCSKEMYLSYHFLSLSGKSPQKVGIHLHNFDSCRFC